MVDIKSCVKNDSFLMPYSLASDKFSNKSLQCALKIKCTCLRTFKASIGTIAIFTRSSRSGSVRCTDSTAGQRVSRALLLIFDVMHPKSYPTS